MKTIKPAEPGQTDCAGLEKLVPGPEQAPIRIRVAGIYGSDIGVFRGTSKLISYLRVTGHKLADIIEGIPADDPKGLKVGDRVIVGPCLYCGIYRPCSIGRTSCCTSLKVLGVHIDGGVAEYCCHPADILVKMPEDVGRTDVTMAEPLTISLHGIHRGGLKAGEYRATIGADPIGLLADMIAQAYGVHAVLPDLVQERLDLARELGTEYVINFREENPVERAGEITGGTMAQQVVECSGANVAILQTLDLASHTDRITLTGWPPKEIPTPTDVATHKEVDTRDARTSVGEFEEAIELIYTKKMDVAKILTKTIGLGGASEAIGNTEKNPGNYMEAVIKMD